MSIKYVKKRDGTKVNFDSEKIKSAVLKAAQAVDIEGEEIAAEITSEVLSYLKIFIKDGEAAEVEQIQDLVEKILIEKGYSDIAKAYILYREQHSKLRDTRKLFSDALNVMNDYLGRDDWKVKENSNMSYSLQGLNNFIASQVTGQYWLQEIYSEQINKLHKSGDLHIHDLGNLSVYCCGWDLEDLLRTGFRGVPTKVESAPPRHFKAALGQIVNFYYTLQGEAAGAQAFSNFDTFLAPFIAYDSLNYKEVKQAMQEFLFNMNVPTRVGFQTPFTNITMDLEVPNYLKDQSVIIGGEYQDKNYGEFQAEMDILNRAFAEVMMEGDAKGRMFSFPIPTYNITKDFDWENEKLNPVWKMTAKYGIPYFSNFVNSDMNPEDARSMCCRLRLDNKELRKRGGGLFGANPMTGSIGIVTLNMPRIGYLAQSKEDFMQRVYYLMDQAKKSLEIKRKVLENLTDQGLYPYSKFYLRDVKKRFDKYWKNHFNTIGLNGMNEALLNFIGEDIASPEGRKFSLEVIDAMRKRLQKYQEETDNLYNLEATPAEGTAYRFARLDRERFGDKIIAANQQRVLEEGADPYYTNSTQLPVGLTDDIFTALELQDELQSGYTGGCIEKGSKVLTDKGLMKIEEIVDNYNELKPIHALSFNPGKNKSEWDLITEAISIDVSHNDKIRVRAEKGLDIVTSDWHPFFVLERKKIEDECPVCGEKINGDRGFAEHIKYNKNCRINYNEFHKYKVLEKRADDLKAGDYLLQNSDNLYSENDNELTEDLMWLLGYFIADNNIFEAETAKAVNYTAGQSVYNLHKKEEHLFKAQSIINFHFKNDLNQLKSRAKYRPRGNKKKSLNSLFLRNIFQLEEQSFSSEIPEEIKYRLNSKNIYSLLKGMLDSSGSINDSECYAEYYTEHEKFADDLLEICSRAGISAYKKEQPENIFSGENHFIIRMPLIEIMKLKAESHSFIEEIKSVIDYSKGSAKKISAVKVKNTDKVNVEDNMFYDLSTEKNHNYLAGKKTLVFIHNTVLHGFLGENMPSVKSTKKLVRRIAENFKLPYYTRTPTFSICPIHGYIAGEHQYCPKCDAEAAAASGAKRYFIQNFRPINTLDPDLEEKRPFTPSELKTFKNTAEKYIAQVYIRD